MNHENTSIDARVESAIHTVEGTGPRVTEARIDSIIVDEQYTVFHGTTTVCCLLLVNGYTVIGKSACAAPENFDATYGRALARADARRQIWALEGYLLRQWMMLEASMAEQESGTILPEVA